MAVGRADRWAILAVVLAGLVITSPLLVHPLGLPPPDDFLGLDLAVYYGFGGAARQTVLRFGQFPLRSPWHGGGHPIYLNPDDATLTPTMFLILAVGPWAAVKIDFVLTVLVAGVGMYWLTRRGLGYPLVSALFSATSFAFGGFLLARWLLGWRVEFHAAWLPWILYGLWRGAERKGWLAVCAALVGWLILDQKYVAMAMGWFLLLVGLIRPGGTGGGCGPDWRYLLRLLGVWTFGLGLAAVKLVPMYPLLREHFRNSPPGSDVRPCWQPVVLWVVLLVGLGLAPWVVRLFSGRDSRVKGAVLAVMVAAAMLVVVAFFAPLPPRGGERARGGVRALLHRTLSFGTWGVNEHSFLTPCAGESFDDPANERFRLRAPVGPVVALLVLLAFLFHPRPLWRWGVLLLVFAAFEASPVLPRDLTRSWGQLPVLKWIRRPWELLVFYYYFLLTLIAGRGLDLPAGLRRLRPCRWGVWVVLGTNVLFLAGVSFPRYAYSVSVPLPAPPAWGEYRLLDRRADRWWDEPCFLLRGNVGLVDWGLDLHLRRHLALIPSHLAGDSDTWQPNPAFRGMAWFEGDGTEGRGANRVRDCEITPEVIRVSVRVQRTPAVLVINQINDSDWQVKGGKRLPRGDLLRVGLARKGEYEVVLRYRPHLLWWGLVVSGVFAVVGVALLVALARRDQGGVGEGARTRRPG